MDLHKGRARATPSTDLGDGGVLAAVVPPAQQNGNNCILELAPTRAWVNGKHDPSALASAGEAQIFIVKTDHGVLDELKVENAKLREEADALTLRVQYEAERAQLGALQERLAAEEQGKAELAEAEQRARASDSALSQARTENQQLAARLRDAGSEIASLRAHAGQAREAGAKVRELDTALRAAHERAAAADAAAGGATSRFASLRDELLRVKALAHEAVRTFREQVGQTERVIGLLRAEQAHVAAREDEIARLKQSLTSARGLIPPLEEEIERLKRRLAEVEGRPAAPTVASGPPPGQDAARVRELEATNGALRAANERLEAAKRELEGRLAAAEGRAGHAGQKEAELERKLREAEERLREAGAAHARERAGWDDEKSALQARLREAETRATTLGAENRSLQGRLSASEARMADLADENERLSREFDDLVTLTFRQIDTDGSLELDGNEIRRALNLLGLTSVSDQELIARHDGGNKRGDAKIQIDEFPALVREMLARMREEGLLRALPSSGGGRARNAPLRRSASPPPPSSSEAAADVERELMQAREWRDEKSALEARLREAETRANRDLRENATRNNTTSRTCVIS